jgi:YVTN family beta-propeller protein
VRWRIGVGPAPQQPAVTRDGERLFVPDILDSAVWVVDLALREAKRLEVSGPDGKPLAGFHNAYAGVERMYVTAVRSRALAVLDARSGETLDVHALPGEPRPAALAADESRVYLQLTGLHGFVAWDLARREEAGRVEWGPLPDETPPPPWTPAHGLGVEPSGAALWATSTPDRVLRVHALPGLEPLGEAPVGEDPNWIAFSPDGAWVYVSNTTKGRPRGSVTVVDRVTRSVVATIPVGREPKRIVALVAP